VASARSPSKPRWLNEIGDRHKSVQVQTPVKLAITITPDLHQALADYAALYADTYGREESIAELIPAMLSAFMESDRSFTRDRSSGR
jgi:hypothetical protein